MAATTTRAQLHQLATKAKGITVEVNTHDGSFSLVAKRHPTTNKILKGFRCFVSGHCLDLSGESSPTYTPHEVAQLLGLV